MLHKKRLMMFIFGCSVISVLIGCKKIGQENKGGAQQEQKQVVEVVTVKIGDIEETIPLTGDIHGDKEVKVYAKVSGKLNRKIKTEGDYIKKDEVVAMIDRDEEALKFSEAEVKSPIDGVVTMYFVGLGEAVFPAQPTPRDPVVMVADIDNIKVIVYLSDRDIGKVKKDQPARITVDAYPDRTFKGVVTNVDPAANPMTRKLKVEITVPNPGHLLKPGTFARVEIIVQEHKNVLLVPRVAVLEREGNKIVFTCENNLAKIINVLTGAEDEKNIEIKKGLEQNQEVITEGNYALTEGTKVEFVR
ncbi:MAG TPA: hypothetical protein DCX95_00820 [Elusimicrobia bacterium]|nr:hypothetical protein [Elusimicrobiota bacterium]